VAKVAPSIALAVEAEEAVSTVEAEVVVSTVEAVEVVAPRMAEAAEAAIAEPQSQARRRRPLLRAAFASPLHCIVLALRVEALNLVPYITTIPA
jgi:hypothetical protein